ncbi:hypothetical protein PV379_03740 [Streptomyces caniscabiei]|uniref:DUF6766 family protein n=1 Tax=Streptomyces caniscabiei TaxID=2746961 RepID=UPI0029B9B8B2|nr:DUF6766 family protein [Streptomyces caniscabiei]MDX2776452.1 hypothetical protein [Streptomyces caniscabiei]
MKRFWRDNSLSIVLFGCFLLFLAGLMVTGFYYENEERAMHGGVILSFGEYLVSGEFYEAVFENWESEFLQMGALVVLTIWLKQKGSKDSKKIGHKEDVDTESRYSIIKSRTLGKKVRAAGHILYANSLSIALFLLFFFSFILHAISGTATANQEATFHSEPTYSLWQYMVSAQFWFESFQNWQSEFLSVGVLIVLSIYLRQRKSPESKPVDAPNDKTGD